MATSGDDVNKSSNLQSASSDPDEPSATVTDSISSHVSTKPPSSPSSPQTQEQPASQKIREFQDTALRFFANASNETLGACAVGLCASTYLVLGRVGLVLIGAVGGVVLHATWEHSQHAGEDEKDRVEAARRRKEQGLELAKRALEWRDRRRPEVGDEDSLESTETSSSTAKLDFSDFQPDTREALTEFTDAVMRDYVKWWYSPLLPSDKSFPSSCRRVLTGFLLSFSKHLTRKRVADPFLDFIANSTSIIIVFLNELNTALKASPNQGVEAAIRTYLEYEPESSLANVLSTQQQERKLRLVADDVLQHFLDPKTYECLPAQAFLREVLAVLILESIVTSCSKAEWINGQIVYALEEGEPEIMNVIDAGVENISGGLAKTTTPSTDATENSRHQRRVRRAEEAMQEALREARKKKGEVMADTGSTISTTTTDRGIMTPSSSDSERNKTPLEDSMLFDSEGNNIPSGTSSPARILSPTQPKSSQFLSFDQITPAQVPTALQPEFNQPLPTESMSAVPLTLHNANITLLDMGTGNDKVVLKQKPNEEFLVQIEPASSRFPGWMVTRKYPDFEPLHETLRRIAVISGVPEFNQQFVSVPNWKGQTRSSVIGQLETYLTKALKYERLAESEAMKKFLDKDTGLDKIPATNKNVLLQGASALDNVGKGFINVIGQGGKGIAGGGKAVLGGVQGVFGAVGSAVGGPKKTSSSARTSTNDLSRTATPSSSTLNLSRASSDYVRGSAEMNDTERPILPPRPSESSFDEVPTTPTSTTEHSGEILNLPPTPAEMSGDFVPPQRTMSPRKSTQSFTLRSSQPSTPTMSQPPTPALSSSPFKPQNNIAPPSSALPSEPKTTPRKQDVPLSEEETRITVDLMFAIITSTYSLSSAWTFRLSLLSAAKTYLLRPNNPQLESIRTLLQESLITNNTTDAAIASYVRKIRENALPTEEELSKWPKELSAEAKEKLRVKARKLLVKRGMPQALTSVMGQAASGEALGKVFDCLQIEDVARGLIFAVMLQALRAVLQ